MVTAAPRREPALLTERRGPILVMTMNRPAARNAIDEEMSRDLADAVALLDGDADLVVGVLTGAPPGFSSGMDLKAYLRGDDLSGVEQVVRHGARTPLIAAIEGFALAGGLELALVCDLLVAGRSARLGIPEASRGLLAGGGGVLRLPARIGVGRALHLALTAQPIDAERAERWGLVTEVTEPGGAFGAALALAECVAANGPLAVAAAKEVVCGTVGMTETEAWEFQTPRNDRVFRSQDAAEGARAFAEKRPPRWQGR